ncbi:hypothetical protein Dsin_001587 [Dipteronia sinensis]|uniref:MULE transposase domain-containing protein n=1 Tax=Dipteronia sinensis TaxID=43782 RepID=A0AAE0B475_9ROSI|nr:hypothetical protein Dsin_001587 [Dipteronia sinensis]
MSSMVDVGIGATKSYFFLANEAGGAENVGFTKKDAVNYLQRRNDEMVETGDAQSLLNHFKRKQDKTTESFVWLLESFLESIGNKQPKTIFTDEDKAMENAIKIVLKETRHRLCTWHITKNATQHLACLYGKPDFKKKFNKCFHGCENEKEFQDSWDDMIKKFNLQGHSWLENCTPLEKNGVRLLVWILFLNLLYPPNGVRV